MSNICPAEEQIVAETLSAEQATKVLKLVPQLQQKGHFTQKKYFKILKKPFVSEGIFSIEPELFEWRTLSPVKNALIYKGSNLYIADANDNLTAEPKGDALGNVLQQLLLGKFERLVHYFVIAPTEVEHCIALKPISAPFEQLFQSIQLCGEKRISTVTLFDLSDNKTQIDLMHDA